MQLLKTKDEYDKPNVEVRLENETVWLNQKQMAELFDRDRKTITRHVSNIFKEAELDEKLVCSYFELTTQHCVIEVPSQSRNPKIAYIFYKTKLVEERNIGMKELKHFIMNSNVKSPSFKMIEPYFVITIYRSKNKVDAVNRNTNENDALNDKTNVNDALNDAVNDVVKQFINDAVNDAVNDAASDAVINRLIQEVLLILVEGGKSLKDLMISFDVARATMQRDMALLKAHQFIVFKGSPRTGVYDINKMFKNEIEKI